MLWKGREVKEGGSWYPYFWNGSNAHQKLENDRFIKDALRKLRKEGEEALSRYKCSVGAVVPDSSRLIDWPEHTPRLMQRVAL